MLTKDQILLVTDQARKEVPVPEWGGSVFIRGMTLEDVDFCQKLGDDSQSLEKTIVRFVCDERGESLFSEDDIPSLKKKSIQAFKRIVKEIRLFNSIEEAEKNSEGTPD